MACFSGASFVRARSSRRSAQIFPDPLRSDADARRFCHPDVEKMSLDRLWSERKIIEMELARFLTDEQRPKPIWTVNDFVLDLEWLKDRWSRLRAEECQRRGGQR